MSLMEILTLLTFILSVLSLMVDVVRLTIADSTFSGFIIATPHQKVKGRRRAYPNKQRPRPGSGSAARLGAL